MIYKRIRDLREDNDMTQAQVGEKINVPQRTYAYYETGERMIPPHVLWALADLYDVSIDYLLGRTDDKNDEVLPKRHFILPEGSLWGGYPRGTLFLLGLLWGWDTLRRGTPGFCYFLA